MSSRWELAKWPPLRDFAALDYVVQATRWSAVVGEEHVIVVPYDGGVDTYQRETAVEAFASAVETVLQRKTGARLGKVRVLGIGLEKYENVWSDQQVREITTGLVAWTQFADDWLDLHAKGVEIDLLENT